MSLDLPDDKSTSVQHQSITWANVDPDRCRYTASLSHHGLKVWLYSLINVSKFIFQHAIMDSQTISVKFAYIEDPECSTF